LKRSDSGSAIVVATLVHIIASAGVIKIPTVGMPVNLTAKQPIIAPPPILPPLLHGD
jgi:hypothetical protein